MLTQSFGLRNYAIFPSNCTEHCFIVLFCCITIWSDSMWFSEYDTILWNILKFIDAHSIESSLIFITMATSIPVTVINNRARSRTMIILQVRTNIALKVLSLYTDWCIHRTVWLKLIWRAKQHFHSAKQKVRHWAECKIQSTSANVYIILSWCFAVMFLFQFQYIAIQPECLFEWQHI